MKKLFALAAVALTLCGLLTACGSKTETANDVDLTGFTTLWRKNTAGATI